MLFRITAYFVLGALVAITCLAAYQTYQEHFAPPVVVNRDFVTHPVFQQSIAPLVFTGDILLARDVERKMQRFGASYPFRYVTDVFKNAQYVIGNFEASVPETHVPTPDFSTTFSVRTGYLSALRTAGITHTSLANNHAGDFGDVGLRDTRDALNAADITSFGSPPVDASSSITYLETPHASIAVIGVSTLPTSPTQQELAQLLAEAEQQSDIQVVYVHWGIEYDRTHSKAQQELAYRAIDAGADMIVGHHPHVVQDVGWYDGTPIFYSLGNFVFDQYFNTDVMQGLLLAVTVPEPDEFSVTLVPVSSVDSHAAPRLMNGPERTAFLTHLAARSDETIRESVADGTITVPLATRQ